MPLVFLFYFAVLRFLQAADCWSKISWARLLYHGVDVSLFYISVLALSVKYANLDLDRDAFLLKLFKTPTQ